MILNRFFGPTVLLGAAMLMMSGGASGTTITFNTDAAGTGFGGGGLSLTNSLGATSTLTYVAAPDTTTGVPSNVNFGNFTLACAACSTQAIGAGSFYNAFSFNLVITDVTDGATGQFVGSSTGGTVFSDVSQLTINWAPLTLGPGVSNALTGSFGPTTFSTTVFTGIVAPNSGEPGGLGQSTIQGFVNSSDVPEPATLGMVGAAMLGLAMLRRRNSSRS